MQNFTRKTLTIPALLASFALGSLLTLKAPEAITTEMVHQASQLFGLTFTEAERDSMLTNLEDYRKGYEKPDKPVFIQWHNLEFDFPAQLSAPGPHLCTRVCPALPYCPAAAALPGADAAARGVDSGSAPARAHH